jgi:hypothetical protein
MAFVAYLNSQRIRVSDFTWLEWVRFQQSYREQHLEMACGMRGVPKLSHRNQPYFAHLRRVGCDCPADSLAQMELKRHVWKAVRAAGWQVEFEVRGQIDTRHWFVDVLACKAQEQVGFPPTTRSVPPHAERHRCVQSGWSTDRRQKPSGPYRRSPSRSFGCIGIRTESGSISRGRSRRFPCSSSCGGSWRASSTGDSPAGDGGPRIGGNPCSHSGPSRRSLRRRADALES